MFHHNTRYGDYENVREDSKILFEIYKRQGANLLIDAIAELAGQMALKYNINSIERERLKNSLIDELREAINERI